MNKLKAFWLKIWNYIKYLFTHPREVLIPTLIAEVVFWIPVWVPALLGIFFSPWWFGVMAGVVAFWAGPLTPAIALQLAFIAVVERWWNKTKIKSKEKKKNDRQ